MYFRSKYGSGGLKAVSSEIGYLNYSKAITHDCETSGGFGGTRSLIQGDLGSGKTTLNNLSLMKFGYIPNIKKMDFIYGKKDECYPETVISRGRRRDYWNLFLPDNFKKSFGNDCHQRQMRVFISAQDDLEFFEQADIESTVIKLHPDIYKYTDIMDLYTHLIDGGINIVYPPNDYLLSLLLKKRLNDILMRSKGGRRYLKDNEDISVPSHTFWFDLIYLFIDIDKHFDDVAEKLHRIQSVTFVIDEAHQVFPDNPSKPYWHLVDNFAEEEMIETRRINLSMWIDCHDYRSIFWKVLQRFNYYIFLKGARAMVKSKLSRVEQSLIDQLDLGQAIIEEKSGRFGKFHFQKIDDQPPALTVKGMK